MPVNAMASAGKLRVVSLVARLGSMGMKHSTAATASSGIVFQTVAASSGRTGSKLLPGAISEDNQYQKQQLETNHRGVNVYAYAHVQAHDPPAGLTLHVFAVYRRSHEHFHSKPSPELLICCQPPPPGDLSEGVCQEL